MAEVSKLWLAIGAGSVGALGGWLLRTAHDRRPVKIATKTSGQIFWMTLLGGQELPIVDDEGRELLVAMGDPLYIEPKGLVLQVPDIGKVRLGKLMEDRKLLPPIAPDKLLYQVEALDPAATARLTAFLRRVVSQGLLSDRGTVVARRAR